MWRDANGNQRVGGSPDPADAAKREQKAAAELEEKQRRDKQNGGRLDGGRLNSL